MSPRVVSLQLHTKHREPLTPVESASGRVGGGLEGDSHVAKSTRSVLVVDRSTLDDLGLRPGDLREQVTVEDFREINTLPAGTQLRLGGITVRVNGPAAPCTHVGEMLDVADPETFRLTLEGRRGAACTVVSAEGVARVGDPVEVLSPVTA